MPIQLASTLSNDQGGALETVLQAMRSNQPAEARRLAEQALATGFRHPLLLVLRAASREEAGLTDEALADLRKAHFLAPDDVAVLNALARCCTQSGRIAEAVACCDKAIAVQPEFAPSWFNRGWALDRQGDVAAAAQSYERAASLQPTYVEAWGSIAWLAARRGDAETARGAAERALQVRPGFVQAILVLAELEPPRTAEQRVGTLLKAPGLDRRDRALAHGQLGDALDAQDRTAEAFAAYEACNRLLSELQAPGVAARGGQSGAELSGLLLDWAERLDPAAWTGDPRCEPSAGGEQAHVFLIGFPRSGTTLIESVLAQHPDVVSLEERNTLDAAVRAFLSDRAGLDRLQSASTRQLQGYRDEYWRIVAQHGVDPRGKVFVDKSPLKTLRLPLISRLFPRAKVIFSVRDPRDVVFSCFRRRLAPNAWSYELLDVERAARFYDRVMRFHQLLSPRLHLAEHQIVYERIVSNFESEVRALCDFIGVACRDELARFSERARRGAVASASAAQIGRGLYGEGVGQWRRYAVQLEPALPILAPWVRRLGYPVE